MHIRIALAVTALLGATGCWIDACEEYDFSLGTNVCTETVSGIFSDEEPGPYGWCGGEEAPMTSCRRLGYTATCRDFHVRPEAALLAICR